MSWAKGIRSWLIDQLLRIVCFLNRNEEKYFAHVNTHTHPHEHRGRLVGLNFYAKCLSKGVQIRASVLVDDNEQIVLDPVLIDDFPQPGKEVVSQALSSYGYSRSERRESVFVKGTSISFVLIDQSDSLTIEWQWHGQRIGRTEVVVYKGGPAGYRIDIMAEGCLASEFVSDLVVSMHQH